MNTLEADTLENVDMLEIERELEDIAASLQEAPEENFSPLMMPWRH